MFVGQASRKCSYLLTGLGARNICSALNLKFQHDFNPLKLREQLQERNPIFKFYELLSRSVDFLPRHFVGWPRIFYQPGEGLDREEKVRSKEFAFVLKSRNYCRLMSKSNFNSSSTRQLVCSFAMLLLMMKHMQSVGLYKPAQFCFNTETLRDENSLLFDQNVDWVKSMGFSPQSKKKELD